MSFKQSTWYRKLFRTFHRILLDRHLSKLFNLVHGNVLILGAGKTDYAFLSKQCSNLIVSDIEAYPCASVISVDAHSIPFPDNTFDTILALEVLEHLHDPVVAAREILRVLSPGGLAILSSPFMFHIHADPSDYTRLTSAGIKLLFSGISLKTIPYGSRFHVILDLISTHNKFLALFRIFNPLILSIFPFSPSHDSPSGYIVIVEPA